MSEVGKVVEMTPGTRPIEDYQPRERLGALLSRYRNAAGKSVAEAAAHLGITEQMMGEVESHQLSLSAGQLQSLATLFKVRYEPLLDAARDWHKAVWDAGGNRGGVQLAEMTTETLSLRQAEHGLEMELIAAADELVFAANVLRETAIRAENAALRAREVLAGRGVEVPGVEPLDGPLEVECSGPAHTSPKKITRGKDFVLSYRSDDKNEEPFYFCSNSCAEAWAKRRPTA